MNTKSAASKGSSYHHGDLAPKLVQFGIEIIEEEGLAALTLRKVAKKAGVSPMAPYRHYENKEKLTRAMANEGFRQLTLVMEREAKLSRTPIRRIERQTFQYVMFAQENNALFQLMFSIPMDITSPMKNDGAEHGAMSFKTLLATIEICQREGILKQCAPMELALVCWSQTHGLANLMANQQLPDNFSGRKFLAKIIKRNISLMINGMAP